MCTKNFIKMASKRQSQVFQGFLKPILESEEFENTHLRLRIRGPLNFTSNIFE